MTLYPMTKMAQNREDPRLSRVLLEAEIGVAVGLCSKPSRSLGEVLSWRRAGRPTGGADTGGAGSARGRAGAPRGPGVPRGPEAPRGGAAPAPLNPNSSGRRFASAAKLFAKTFWCAWSALSFARASLECVASSATRAISAASASGSRRSSCASWRSTLWRLLRLISFCFIFFLCAITGFGHSRSFLPMVAMRRFTLHCGASSAAAHTDRAAPLTPPCARYAGYLRRSLACSAALYCCTEQLCRKFEQCSRRRPGCLLAC